MTVQTPSVPRIIYIMGIDGSGKSTVSEYLAEQLKENGYDVDIIWLRFNNVISKPFLGLCRLLGFTQYETVNGIRVGYHNFYKSSFISVAFIFFQYLDAVRVKYTKILPRVGKPNKVVILDRYVYDILIDMAVDTRKNNLLLSWAGDQFKKLLPVDTMTLLIRRDLNDVLKVRPEGEIDRNFAKRYQYYEQLKNEPTIHTIDNSGSLKNLLDSAMQITGISHEV